MPRGIARVLAALLVGSVAVTLLGASLIPALLEPTTMYLGNRHARVDEAGISREAMQEVLRDLHSFSVVGSIPDLPREVEGRPAFDGSMVDHLVDVRVLIHRALGWTAAAALLSLGLTIALRDERRMVSRALTLGAIIPFVLVSALALWAAVDFDSFFSWFHSLFFAGGTWTFPSSSLLIQAVPEPFWIGMGMVWAVSLVGLVALTLVVARVIRRRESAGCKRGFLARGN